VEGLRGPPARKRGAHHGTRDEGGPGGRPRPPEEDPLAVARPPPPAEGALGRALPLPAARREAGHIELEPSRLVRVVEEPVPVRRESRDLLVGRCGHDGERLAIAEQGQGPDIPLADLVLPFPPRATYVPPAPRPLR